jgi:hypothetical protein
MEIIGIEEQILRRERESIATNCGCISKALFFTERQTKEIENVIVILSLLSEFDLIFNYTQLKPSNNFVLSRSFCLKIELIKSSKNTNEFYIYM